MLIASLQSGTAYTELATRDERSHRLFIASLMFDNFLATVEVDTSAQYDLNISLKASNTPRHLPDVVFTNGDMSYCFLLPFEYHKITDALDMLTILQAEPLLGIIVGRIIPLQAIHVWLPVFMLVAEIKSL